MGKGDLLSDINDSNNVFASLASMTPITQLILFEQDNVYQYLLLAASGDVETQRKGIVFVVWGFPTKEQEIAQTQGAGHQGCRCRLKQ